MTSFPHCLTRCTTRQVRTNFLHCLNFRDFFFLPLKGSQTLSEASCYFCAYMWFLSEVFGESVAKPKDLVRAGKLLSFVFLIYTVYLKIFQSP